MIVGLFFSVAFSLGFCYDFVAKCFHCIVNSLSAYSFWRSYCVSPCLGCNITMRDLCNPPLRGTVKLICNWLEMFFQETVFPKVHHHPSYPSPAACRLFLSSWDCSGDHCFYTLYYR